MAMDFGGNLGAESQPGCHSELQIENIRLLERNQQLESDIATLKRQLADAIPIKETMEQLATKHADLQKRLFETESERDEMKGKLAICLQRIENLQGELEQSTYRQSLNAETESNELRMRLEESEKQRRTEIANLKEQLLSNQRLLDEAREKARQLENETSALLKAGSQHFATEILTSEQLVEMLLVPPEVSEEQVFVVSPRKRHHKKRPRKIERIVEYDIQGNDELMLQTVKEVQLQLEEMTNRMERCEEERVEVEKENFELKQEIARVKGQIECLKVEHDSEHLGQMVDMSEKLKATTQKLSESERKRETLTKQLRPLLTKVHTLEVTVTKLKAEIAEARTENDKLTQANESLASAYKTLESNSKETDAAHQSANEKNARLVSENEELKRMIDVKTGEIEKLALTNGSLESMRAEDKELQENYQKQIESITEMAQRNEALYESTKQELDEEKTLRQTAEAQVRKLKEQLAKPQNVDVTDLLGLAALTTDKFPVELAETIQEISNNSTLMPPTKLRQIFATVNEYFRSTQTRLEEQIEALKNRPANPEIISTFLHQAFPDYVDQFEELDNSAEAWNQFTDFVVRLRKQGEVALSKVEDIENGLMNICFALGVDDADGAKQKIDENKQLIASMQDQLEDLQSDIKRVSQEAEAWKADETGRHQAEVAKYEQTIAELQHKYEGQKQKEREILKDLQIKTGQMNDKNIELLGKIQALEAAIQKAHADLAMEKKNSVGLNAENDKLKKTLERARNTRKLNKLREKELRKQMEQLKASLNPLSGNVTHEVQEFVDKRTQSLQMKLADLEQTIGQLREDLSATDNQRATESKRADDLEMKLQKCLLESDIAQKNVARERKLIEENMKHQQVLSESNLKKTVREMNAKLNETKRELMTNVIMQFSSMFDFNAELNDASFATFINIVRDKMLEFVATESRLRRLLSLAPNQSIEAEVSHMVLKQR